MDFFDSTVGAAAHEMRRPRLAAFKDRLMDLALARHAEIALIDQAVADMPRQKILVVGVEVPSRDGALAGVIERLKSSRHEVVVSTTVMKPKGKFENVSDAIAAASRPLSYFDWIFITDDDVGLPDDFTDRYVATAHLAGLAVSQPAHAFESYATFELTRRQFSSLARQTKFVEIGPLTVFHRDAFEHMIPFPSSRWAWGLDLVWAEICKRNGLKMGVIDALPVQHLKPVGENYDKTAAMDEALAMLAQYDVDTPRAELLKVGRKISLKA